MCCECCKGREITRTRQQLFIGANSHLAELATQTLEMYDDGLEIYQKPTPGNETLWDQKSIFQENFLDDDNFEMESDGQGQWAELPAEQDLSHNLMLKKSQSRDHDSL